MSNIADCGKFIQDSLAVLERGYDNPHISLSDAYIILAHFNLLPSINEEKQKLILLSPRLMVIYGSDSISLFVNYLRNSKVSKENKQEVTLFYIHNHLCIRHIWDIIYEACYDNTINECNLAITIEYLTGVYYQKINIIDFSILEHYRDKYKICKILLAILCSRDKSTVYSKEEAAKILFTNRYQTFKYGNCSYLSDIECRDAYKKLVVEDDDSLKMWTL